MNEDFDYGEEPKKGFMGGLFTKKEKPVMMEQRSRNMPQPQMGSDDLMKLLGGAYKSPDDQNMALDYVGNSYVPIGDTYKPIHSTYQSNDYKTPEYVPFQYESPGYESASGTLFGGGEQGKAWEQSPVFQKTGVGFMESNPNSPLYNQTGMSDILFGSEGQTPALNPITGKPEEFPMKLPAGATLPYQKVTPVTQFSPSPVNLNQPAVQQMPVQQVPQQMPTMPTQVIPPQYVPAQQFKRPVGRPRLNKPPKPKRPVGRPRKIQVEQMTEIQ